MYMENKIKAIKEKYSIEDILILFGLQLPDKNNKIKSIYNPDEKTPSMHIYRETNRFKDFSSGISGDLIDLYKAIKNIDLNTAIAELFNKVSTHQKTRTFKYENKDKNTLQRIEFLENTSKFGNIHTTIWEYNPKNENMVKEYTERIIRPRQDLQEKIYSVLFDECKDLDEKLFEYLFGPKRNLCFANIKFHKLLQIKNGTEHFLKSNFSPVDLINAGLFTEDGYFIFNQYRLIIPYLQSDKIVYLRGRYFDEAGNSEPLNNRGKYISLYNKYAQNLQLKRWYNLDCLSLNDIEAGKDIYIFEGEFDAMKGQQESCYSIGFPGTGNFPYHNMDFLKDWDIYLCTDNDPAGDKVAFEIATAIKRNLNKPTKRLKLQGKDISESLKGGEWHH